MSSSRWSSAPSPLSEGQSTFSTEAIHIARNSAAAARVAPRPRAVRAARAGPAAPAAASSPAAPASSFRRPMYVM